ncbi:MAG: ABC transporter ATP-binding protein [Bacillota bacterium]|uniref:ATP-binding cassette domain-containing protein n=1 Tax=Thermanaerosceptrum fracticalcis TaxID=1712410 RepID=A0A7G6E3L7_THEFR|nr:ABC transporter ATP-binding protein [Thermanaerosceptrum fracticalcis]QNB46671.1 ATP-binding cassette domain-containing protein [Thermanaerosceptrum fracticalcis]
MILSVQGLKFSYPSRPVLENVNFALEKGECLAVLGTNGAGKSTLLKCLNRILKPQGGIICLGEEALLQLNLNALARRVGYVAQKQENPRNTVFDAVLLGRKPYIQWDVTKKDLEITVQVLQLLELEDLALRYLDELSGGELQKVVIARALAQEPDLLLFDEPTSNLDLRNQVEVTRLIKKVVKERGLAAVVTMHDLNLALRFADKYLLLKKGAVFAAGGVEVITPENVESVYAVPVVINKYQEIPVVIPL